MKVVVEGFPLKRRTTGLGSFVVSKRLVEYLRVICVVELTANVAHETDEGAPSRLCRNAKVRWR